VFFPEHRVYGQTGHKILRYNKISIHLAGRCTGQRSTCAQLVVII